MRIPQSEKKLEDFVRDIVEQCGVSRESRIEQGKLYKQLFYNGRDSGEQAPYNRVYSHIDRLSSFLFSADDVRFSIDLDEDLGSNYRRRAEVGARQLNRSFHRRNVDLQFGQGVDWGLIKGKALIKLLWGHNGLEAWIVQPESFGVLNESVAELDRQEAFCHTTFISKDELERQLSRRPDGKRLAEDIAKKAAKPSEDDMSFRETAMYQMVIGGINPVSSMPSSLKGNVGVTSMPMPMLDPKVLASMVRIDELWVQDTDRDDWTTIRVVHPDTIIEGVDRHRNLLTAYDSGDRDNPGDNPLQGEQPFREVCPNVTDGYFWGQSEIVNLKPLQAMLTDSIEDIDRLTKLQAQPPAAFIGFTGMNEQKYKTLMVPRGYMAESSPNAKIEKLAPEIPKEIFEKVEKVIAWMDDSGGFAPITMGQGEPGVRAGMHAQTLLRTGSPRMRDRALLVERQCAEVGDLAFKYLQAKDIRVYQTKGPDGKPEEQFMLSQIPDGYKIVVDSHSGSPVFHEDTQQLAFALAKLRAIAPKDLIMLTRPPHMDSLMERAEASERAQAQMIAQHPEVLAKGHKSAK